MKLPIFKLEKFFYKYEFHAPYNLCASDIEPITLKQLLSWADDETLALWENLNLGYTPVEGSPLLRKEIAKLYQNAKEVATFAGAEEAIFVVMQSLLKTGDHVIVPSPCYQSLSTIPKTLGADVSVYNIKERSGTWQFDIKELTSQIRENTRLIVINFPHNPTSAHIDLETLQEIVNAAKNVGAYLFSDEVYRFSEVRGPELPPAGDLYDKAISLGVMSKTLSLAGLRIGWIATQDKELLEELLEYKSYLSICNSAPSELLALIALRAKDKILERNRAILRRNLDLLDQFFQKYSRLFVWKRPTAGSTAFVKLLAPLTVAEFTDDLVHKEGVLLLPGSVYDYPGNYFRIGYGRKNLPECLERLARYLNRKFVDRHEY